MVRPRYHTQLATLLMAPPKSDTMDILDEKVNGGPSMEIIDEVVSVRDRKSSLPVISLAPYIRYLC
jgi:hypothetical protein